MFWPVAFSTKKWKNICTTGDQGWWNCYLNQSINNSLSCDQLAIYGNSRLFHMSSKHSTKEVKIYPNYDRYYAVSLAASHSKSTNTFIAYLTWPEGVWQLQKCNLNYKRPQIIKNKADTQDSRLSSEKSRRSRHHLRWILPRQNWVAEYTCILTEFCRVL